MSDVQNRQFILASRPNGQANESNIHLKTTSIPAPEKGEVLTQKAGEHCPKKARDHQMYMLIDQRRF